MSPAPRYDLPSRLFHWLTAGIVLIAFVLGPEHFGRMMRQGLDPATRLDIVWHETLGVSVFVLTAARLLWLLLRPAAPRFAMAPAMRLASQAVHLSLWALLLCLPVTAILALGTEGHPLTLLGGFRFDPWAPIAASGLASLADWGEVHGVLGDAILVLAGLHALAAIAHHLLWKDGVLRSMLPGGAR